jgi:hypothetical protein
MSAVIEVQHLHKSYSRGDGGFGLVAMRQRIEGLAGTLRVESEPGGGHSDLGLHTGRARGGPRVSRPKPATGSGHHGDAAASEASDAAAHALAIGGGAADEPGPGPRRGPAQPART